MKHLLSTCKYFALFIFLAFLSCKLDEFQNPQSQNVLIKLPEWPPLDLHYNDYPALDNWNVHVNYGNIDFEFSAPSFIRKIPFTCNGNAPISVIAYPITNGTKIFEPCGAILPYSSELTWETGFTALILHKFYMMNKNTGNIQLYAQKINWQKMNEVLTQKTFSTKVFYNPFLLNQEKILNALLNQELSTSLFTLKKCYPVPVSDFTAIQKGTYLSSYIPENVFSAVTNNFTVSKSAERKFFYSDTNPKIAIAVLENTGILSLSFTDLPIK